MDISGYMENFSSLKLWLNGGKRTGLQLLVKRSGSKHIVWPCAFSTGDPTFLSKFFTMTSWPYVVLFSVSPVHGVLWSTWRSMEKLFYHMLLSYYRMIGFCHHGIWIDFLKWVSVWRRIEKMFLVCLVGFSFLHYTEKRQSIVLYFFLFNKQKEQSLGNVITLRELMVF